jgi:transposase
MADPRLHRDPRPPLRRRRPKKADGTGGQAEQALGRSRGGFGTKVHGRFNGLGLPVTLVLSPGQDHDVTHAPELLGDAQPQVVIADKGYDSRSFVKLLLRRGAKVVIPSRSNAIEPRELDEEQSKDRNLAERFWSKAKPYRRVATRYEKTARNFLAIVHLAAIMALLQ